MKAGDNKHPDLEIWPGDLVRVNDGSGSPTRSWAGANRLHIELPMATMLLVVAVEVTSSEDLGVEGSNDYWVWATTGSTVVGTVNFLLDCVSRT